MSTLRAGQIPWTRIEALILIAVIEAYVISDWGVALTGSLLTHETGKDLDLVFYPMTTDVTVREPESYLKDLGITIVKRVEEVHEAWRTAENLDAKHVEIYKMQNRRIDVFTFSVNTGR